MNDAFKAIISVATAIIGLTILSVIVSRKSQTPQVISASTDALTRVIRAAVDPVATSATNGNLGANTFSSPVDLPTIPNFFDWLTKPLF